MNIVIVEDDHLQADWLIKNLKERLSGVKIQHITTELEFRNAIEKLQGAPPDLILLDVMLRWTDAEPGMVSAPEEVRRTGFFGAGSRCERLLRQQAGTESVPVILYTVLEKSDFKNKDFDIDLDNLHPKTLYVGKNWDITDLFSEIRKNTGS